MTTTDVREWAQRKGLEIGAHGRIPKTVQDAYDAEHQAPAIDEYPDAAYDGGVTVADFPPEPEPETPEPGHPAERRPRVIKPAPAARGIVARLRAPRQDKAKGRQARPGKKHPRVSLTGFIEDVWSQLAWAAAPVPPVQRLLWIQAPYAGIALEDALRDTIVDRALQPVARAEEKAKAVGGLIMPPMALLAVLATAPQPAKITAADGTVTLQWPEPGTQHKAAVISLRWSLMLMIETGRVHAAEYQARAEAAASRGREADELMAFILGMPEAPVAEGVQAEEEAVARAQALFSADGDNR